MGRYIVLWEADETKIPLDPTVREKVGLPPVNWSDRILKTA